MNRSIISYSLSIALFFLHTASFSADNFADSNSANSKNIVQIIASCPVPVLVEISSDAQILGLANRGTSYPLIHLGNSWVKINYKGKEGYVEKRFTAVLDAPTHMALKDGLFYIMILLIILLVILILFIISKKMNTVQGEWIKSELVSKNILIASHTNQQVQRYLTNSTTSLSKCFSELGFTIKFVKDPNMLMDKLAHSNPDVLLVDWNLSSNIHNVIERTLTTKTTNANIFVIFYNVTNPETIQKSKIIPNAQYLGLSFTDRELFSLVTPLIITGDKQKKILNSVEESALEGDIENDGLIEVFQFIEIGQKTGCLLIEDKKPLGIVYFRNGLIVSAVSGKETGKNAIFKLLYFKSGKFRFILDKKPKSENCQIPTLGILMEWTQKLDEANGR